MSTLLVKPRAGGGRVMHVTPKTAKWTHVGFDLWKRKAGELATGTDGDRETCLVFVSGRGSVRVGAEEFGILVARASPFEGRPWSVYVPPSMVWSVEATEDMVLAVCSAPGKGKLPPRIIPPDVLVQETARPRAPTCAMSPIFCPNGKMAENLLVVEVLTPAGNTSSYPPHKHDRRQSAA